MMTAVTSDTNNVTIRPPLLIRVYVVAFLIFWLAMVGWSTMIHAHGASAAIGLVFMAFGLGLGYRLLRLGVTSAPDGTLAIRNNLSTRVLTRTEIEEFRLGTSGGTRLGQQSLQALLRDGTVYNIDVGRYPLAMGKKQNAGRLQALTTWLHTTS